MSFGQYQFLSWARRGIARKITEADTLGQSGGNAVERAGISISVEINETPLPEKVFALTGPGDITGIQSSMIIRTEPPSGVSDYEPNLLPYVEFYDEDFPWRYSPSAPAGNQEHLRPWIALIVLKEGEFEDTKRRQPLPSIKITDPANLPPADQLHLWAHMHSNLPHVESEFETFIDNLEEDAKRDPDGVYSRLLCPRKLEPNVLYHAFLVPGYETGRLAGTGRSTVEIKAQQPAWPSGDTEFPVYYRWHFRTGQNFDFEYLVKLLEPRIMDERVGLRPMDCSRPGFVQADKDEEVSAPAPSTILLEGALKSTEAKPTVFPAPEAAQPFLSEIEKLVNLNRFQEENPESDPYVSIPYYGMYHAMQRNAENSQVQEVPVFDPLTDIWYNDLNRDPRTRVAAGFGVRVVQENQERFMDKAWKQLEGVLELNRKMAAARFSSTVSQYLYNKTIKNRKPEDLISLAAPLVSRILTGKQTLKYKIQESILPAAIFNAGFKSILRNKSSLVKGLQVSDVTGSFVDLLQKMNTAGGLSTESKPTFQGIEGLNAVTSFQAFSSVEQMKAYAIRSNLEIDYSPNPPVVSPGGIKINIDKLKPNGPFVLKSVATKPILDRGPLKPVIDINKPPLIGTVKIAPILGKDLIIVKQPDTRQLNVAVSEAIKHINSRFAYREPVATANYLEMTSIAAQVNSTINPALSYRKLMAAEITLPPGTKGVPEQDFLPAMAYPDIPEPAYKFLTDIDKELLLPNLELIPQNTLSLLKTNQKFIEAYLTGLNYEMGRELLWREYPTDMRGSYFRQFWDTNGLVTPETTPQGADQLKDIRPVHEWAKTSLLGSHNARDAQGDTEQLVFVIRGELLKKFPNTVIYAQKALFIEGKKVINENLTAEQFVNEVRFPLYQADIIPDIKLLGFDLTIKEAAGIDKSNGDNEGWFFIIAEVPGEPRFGMDVSFNPNKPGLLTWNDLSWENFGSQNIKFISKDVPPGNAENPPGSFIVSNADKTGTWGKSAADMAAILFQKPVMVATHATEMLNVPVPHQHDSTRLLTLLQYIHPIIT